MNSHQHRERVLHGDIASEHAVQLFDGLDSLSESVAHHLRLGWGRGDSLLVVARPRHWAEATQKLQADGCPVDELTASGRLVVLDGATTLASLMVDGRPDANRFEEHITALVARMCAESGAGLAAYGEMVDILAEQGDLRAAEQLEQLWNGLSQRFSFNLLCGYASAHFTDERMTHHLQAICSAHSVTRVAETDLLASWLLADRRPAYHTDAK